MMVTRLVREVAAVLVNHLPARVVGRLVEGHPGLVALQRPGRAITVRTYLCTFTITGDPVYAIERAMLTGAYDHTSLSLIGRIVQPGMVRVDVGANVGAITFALARAVGPTGHVFALEPGPPIVARLRQNCAHNPRWTSVVHVEALGLSDRPGVLYWSEDGENRGNGGLLHQSGQQVPVVTFDTWWASQNQPRLDFIKIDVEGMEYEVLRGAQQAFRQHRPIIYFETLTAFAAVRGFDIFRAIGTLLNVLAYALYYVDPDGSICRTTIDRLSANTLAIPLERSPEDLRTSEPLNPEPLNLYVTLTRLCSRMNCCT